MKTITLIVILLVIGAVVVWGGRGDWHTGYAAAHRKATSFNNWEQLVKWSDRCSWWQVAGVPKKSVDLGGGTHLYIDSYLAGYKDGCASLSDEAEFIATHNSGGPDHFLSIMKGYISDQDFMQIIPPGHF